MRLKKVTVQNFLSYKDKTVIDFNQFGNNIVLLFGGSGSGKTSIFDAVSFGLYGKSSGSDRSKGNIEDYHSDYAKTFDANGVIIQREPMLVRVEFDHDGKEYVCERIVDWGDKGTNKGLSYTCSLFENGIKILDETTRASTGNLGGKKANSKKDKETVNDKVESILGLNAEQFSQVIILAQGEFEKFLKANSNDREEILTKLVDTQNYKDFEYRIKLFNGFLRDILENIDSDIASQIDALCNRETTSDIEKQQYQSRNPELIQFLSDNLTDKQDACIKLKTEYGELSKEKAKLDQERGKHEAENKAYDDNKKQLDSAVARLNELASQEATIKSKEVDNKLIENILKVIPNEKAAKAAQKSLDDNNTLISNYENSEKNLTKLSKQMEEASEVKEKNNTPEIERLTGLISNLDNNMPQYDTLEKAQKDYNTAKKKLSEAEANVKKLAESLEKQKNELLKVEESLLTLKDESSAKVVLLEKQLKDANQKIASLTKIWKEIPKLKSAETNKDKQAALVVKLENDTREAGELRNTTEQAFNFARRQHTAGELGEFMRDELAEKDTVECPVCHTLHSRADIEVLEILHDMPEAKAKEEAAEKYKILSDQFVEAKIELGKIDSAFKSSLEHLLDNIQIELSVEADWQKLQDISDANNVVSLGLKKAQSAANELYTAVSNAKTLAKRKADLEEERKRYDTSINALQKELTDANTNRDACSVLFNDANVKLSECKVMLKGLPETKAEAVKLLDDNQKAKDALQKEITDAKKACDECASNLSKVKGNLETARNNKSDLENKKNTAFAAYTDDLTEVGFKNVGEYLTARNKFRNLRNQIFGQKELETLKDTQTRAITKYNQDVEKVNNDKAHFEDALKGKVHFDMAPLMKQIEELAENLNEVNTKATNLSSDIKIHEDVLKHVTNLMTEKLKKDKIAKVVKDLADTVKGKITLNRYVLNEVFSTMLDKANDRLSSLCSGQYELRPVLKGDDNRTLQGLDFEVHDCINQTSRMVGSNSGGEKFDISLALALGLSDIVQSHGKNASKIESLFIDEGFGSLGKEDLDKTIKLLLELSGGTRQIGVISHNTTLEQAINNQVVVTRDKTSREGSKIRIKKE